MTAIRAHRLTAGAAEAPAKTCQWHRGCTEPVDSQGHCSRHFDKLRKNHKIRSGLVDPAPVRARIQEHLDRGRTYASLATACGVSRPVLEAIHRGRTPKVLIRTTDRVLAVPRRPSNLGCLRRLHALWRIGHTIPVIAEQAELPHNSLRRFIKARHFPDYAADRLAAAYGQLSNTPGASEELIRRCARKSYAPPAAWDYLDIDDPAVRPLGTRRTAPTRPRRAPGRAHTTEVAA